MEHLAKDLTNALEESESCPMNFDTNCGMRRRTRSAGNLHFVKKSGDNRSDDSSSSYSEVFNKNEEKEKNRNKIVSFHQSDSDDLGLKVMTRNWLRMKNSLQPFIRNKCNKKLGICHSLESDSFNEHSPARPSFRRKRKYKRMNIEETPIPPCGKRKRSHILENGHMLMKHGTKIKPLHKSIVEKIEKFCKKPMDDGMSMETQSIDENLDENSESSLSWSGGEGHEGDDELTDWAPSVDTPADPYLSDYDPREIRAGCRRLGDERPGFSIVTTANERIAKFLQDTSKSELKLFGTEEEKIRQLANLYSLDLSADGTLLRKTRRTPCMQPTQRHLSSLSAGHKKIRTHAHVK